MQTSALPPLPADWPMAEYTGTLLQRAEARTVVCDHVGHTLPALCMELVLEPNQNTMHVEQPFPAGQFDQCQAAAHRLKKGMRVTVHAPMVGMRLVARNVVHVHVIHDSQEKAA